VTSEDWPRLKVILADALEREEDERDAFLLQACGEDRELLAQARTLIAAEKSGGSTLDRPVVLAFEATEASRVGERVGAYEILEEIGHGGMGTVYVAQRADEQYRKKVAIKVVRRGMDTDFILRRFRMERQILAALDHPHIARLADGGVTEDGLPYFVMEHVEGEPLPDYCDSRRLSISERLRLFLDVCSAVEFAHQNLVVHRDLKPANILVTKDGTVKLLDFGIAKLLNPDIADGTIEQTGSLLRLMTPDYASPEQVKGEPITTSSDIYSLGVALYELLTGHRPYRVRTSDPGELARMVCQEEPPKPSAAVTRVEEVTRTGPDGASSVVRVTPELVSALREGDPSKLRRRLHGDLDNIVLMALRKERERRYVSVERFAADIQRHLDGRPVSARRPTLGYRAAKFAGRHRAGVAASAFILAALVTGLVWDLRETRRARAAEARAERRFNDVRKLARSLLFEIHDSVAKLSGATPARKLIVERALEYLDSLAKESGGDSALTRELATAYERVGEVQGHPYTANLGDTAGAFKSYRKALDLRETLAARSPRDPGIQLELANTLDHMGQILGTANDPAAIDAIKRSLAIREALVAVNPKGVETRNGLATSYHMMAAILTAGGKYREAVAVQRKEMDLFEALWKENPGDSRAQRNVALSYKYAGGTLEALKDYSASLELYRKAVAVDEARSSADPTSASARLDLSYSYGALAQCLAATGDLAGGIQAKAKAVAIQESLVAADPGNVDSRAALGRTYRRMGGLLLQQGEATPARDFGLKAVRLFEGLSSEIPENKQELAAALGFLADAETALAQAPAVSQALRRGHRRNACSAYERSATLWTQLGEQKSIFAWHADEPARVSAALARCREALKGR
jgi:serine/threonine protein kinase/tetratricopeptide (TPR) repeat protein